MAPATELLPPPAPNPASEAVARRNRLLVIIAVATVVVGGWMIWSFVNQSRHDAATSEVVDAVSKLDEQLSYGDLSDAFATSFVDESDLSTDVYHMLEVDTPNGSQSTLEPLEISQGDTSMIIKYQVDTSGRSSCVASVIRQGGYRVETIPGYCGKNPPSQGLLDFMNG